MQHRPGRPTWLVSAALFFAAAATAAVVRAQPPEPAAPVNRVGTITAKKAAVVRKVAPMAAPAVVVSARPRPGEYRRLLSVGINDSVVSVEGTEVRDDPGDDVWNDDHEAAEAEQPRRTTLHVRLTEGTFENVVFGRASNAGQAQGRFERLLETKIEVVDRVCRLSDAQKAKLRLAGRGDIERFFDLVERKQEKYRERFVMNDDENQRELLNWVIEMARDVQPLRNTLQNSPFGDGSLFSKALKTHLTSEQAAVYARVMQAESAKTPQRPLPGIKALRK
jgi:hypothetical protein